MKKVYSGFAICLSAFLGGPLAGAYLLSKNFNTFDDPENARSSLRIGLITTLGMFLVMLIIPKEIIADMPSFLMPLLSTFAAHLIVEKYQKKQLAEIMDKGAAKESNWKAAGISVIFAFISMLILFTFVILTELF